MSVALEAAHSFLFLRRKEVVVVNLSQIAEEHQRQEKSSCQTQLVAVQLRNSSQLFHYFNVVLDAFSDSRGRKQYSLMTRMFQVRRRTCQRSFGGIC